MLLSSATVKAATSRLIVVTTRGTLFHPWQVFWFFGPRGHWLPVMGPLRPARLPPPAGLARRPRAPADRLARRCR